MYTATLNRSEKFYQTSPCARKAKEIFVNRIAAGYSLTHIMNTLLHWRYSTLFSACTFAKNRWGDADDSLKDTREVRSVGEAGFGSDEINGEVSLQQQSPGMLHARVVYFIAHGMSAFVFEAFFQGTAR